MKKIYWLILIVSVAVVALCLWAWLNSESRQDTRPRLQTVNRPDGSKSPTPPEPSSSVQATPTKDELESQKEKTIVAAFATPISIFGKVFDERHQPIANAMVEIGINDKPAQPSTSYVLASDDVGRFSLVGVHGISFSVRASKAGYYTSKDSTTHRNVVFPAHDDADASSQDNPLILVLRRKVSPQPLIHVSSRQIDISASPEPVSVDLSTGQVGHGQLQIVGSSGDTNSRRFDWSYRLIIPNGGIMERQEEFQFQAPDTGYLGEVQISQTANEQSWSADVSKDYFIKLPDGRYGRIAINFYPGRRNFVVIESFVNPSPGNHNLEFSGD